MSEHNMDHLEHLGTVAAEDVRFVLMREATYMGSWKRRGGVGAFMMLARKWDRLEQMLDRPAARYDVFEYITRDPQGNDGSALAEVRDLRRYLLLVEAEMIARGVVGRSERPRPTVAELEEILKEPAGSVTVMPDGSVTAAKKPLGQRVAEGWIGDAERALRAKIAENDHETRPDSGRRGGHAAKKAFLGDCSICSEAIYGERIEDGDGLLYHPECYAHKPSPPGTPADGGHHERVVPRYTKERLEDGEANSGQFSAGIRDPLSGTEYQLINRHILPAEQWDHLPRLAIELNNKEWEEARPEYRGLYEWYEEPSKWVMRPAYREHWGRSP